MPSTDFGSWLKSHLANRNLALQTVALEYCHLAKAAGLPHCSMKTVDPLLARLLKSPDDETRAFFLGDAAKLKCLARACNTTVQEVVRNTPTEWKLREQMEPVVVVDAASVALALGMADPISAATRVVDLLKQAKPPVDYMVAVPFQTDTLTLFPEAQQTLDAWRQDGRLVEPPREGVDVARHEVQRLRKLGCAATRLGGDSRDAPRWHRLQLELRNGTLNMLPTDYAQRLRQTNPPGLARRPLRMGPDRFRVVVRHALGKDPSHVATLQQLPSDVRVLVDDMLQGYDVREQLEELGWQWSPTKGKLFLPMEEQGGKHVVITHEVFHGGDSFEWRSQFLPHGAETTASKEEILQMLPDCGPHGLRGPFTYEGFDRITTLRVLALLQPDAMGWWDCTDGPVIVNADGLRQLVVDERILFATVPPGETAIRNEVKGSFPLTLLSPESPCKASRALLAMMGEQADDPICAMTGVLAVQELCDRWLKDDTSWCLLTPSEMRQVLSSIMAAACEVRQQNDVSFTIQGVEVLQRSGWVARPLGHARMIEQWMHAVAAFEEQRFVVAAPPTATIVARSSRGPTFFTFRGMRFPSRKRQPLRLFMYGERMVADAGDLVVDTLPGWRMPAFTMDPVNLDAETQQVAQHWARFSSRVADRAVVALHTGSSEKDETEDITSDG